MPRDFDGTDDNLTTPDNSVSGIGSTSVNIVATVELAVQPVGTDALCFLLAQVGAGNARYSLYARDPVTAGWRIQLNAARSGGVTGVWRSDDIALGRHDIMITYDASSTTNDPVFWVDGVSVTVNEITAPSGGTPWSDQDTIRYGENAAGAEDWAGTLGWLQVHGGTLWGAAEANRHRWWGRATGGPSTTHASYPLVTDDLNNQGSGGSATLAAAGTTMTSMPRVMRPCCGGW